MCEHLDFDNQRDCENEGKYVCLCCGVPVCEEHAGSKCIYGGEGYVEV